MIPLSPTTGCRCGPIPCSHMSGPADSWLNENSSTSDVVIATAGWLVLGGIVMAAFWVTGKEARDIFRGKA
jgi:hypothetical protein